MMRILPWLCYLLMMGLAAAAKDPYVGSFIGTLSNMDQGIWGQLYSIDENTVYLRNFTYTGTGSVAIFVYGGTLGDDGGYTKTGYPLRDIQGSVQKLQMSDKAQNHVLKFPEGKTLRDVDWLGLIDRKNKALLSRVLVDDQVKASIPKPVNVEPLLGRNGLSSSQVSILDSRTVLIKDFSFKGRAPDTHFLVGVAGTIPNDIDGFVIPNERGSNSPLGPYDNQTIILKIPSDKPDLHNAKWLSIWSQKIKMSLAHTLFPTMAMGVPPSINTLGKEPEPSLNCEELEPSLGLELRWTLSQDDIILQLVSNTGNDRYLALGIRDPDEVKGIAGDVVVGWISSSTGKGGVDDYFLAGKRIPCDDGAESCPDKSKGGTKDIQLMNAVSRANYTMLTLKRPVKSPGALDVDIVLDREQFIFWSVGYKSAAMRKAHKPLKNPKPISIHFGRRPLWNCLNGEPLRSSTPTAPPKIDEPRRRIATPDILTPPASANRTPAAPKRSRVPMRPTRRPATPRTRTKPTKSWSDWFTPPTTAKPLSVNNEWDVPSIGCGQTADKPLYVHLGPAIPGRGNQGLGSDGTALYLNGLLAPEITLQRGKEYTFVVETGLGSDPQQTFHPFYITNDVSGGRQFKTDLEARAEKVFAGVTLSREGKIVPSAMGKLCRWMPARPVMTYASFSDLHKNLQLKCENEPSTMAALLRSAQVNNPSVLKFIPDNTMPDELYYQSFMGKHLGNKIHITNYCYDSQTLPKDISTYRPTILEHFSKPGEILASAETRRGGPNNRRVDDDAFDYDYNSFDNEKDLLNKCRRRSRVQGRSLDSNKDMPTFEHFPMRDMLRTSGLDEELPNEDECRRLLQLQVEEEQPQEKKDAFESLMKFDKKGYGGRFNPNQERIVASPTTMAPIIRRTTPIFRSPRPTLYQNPTRRAYASTTTTARPPQTTPSSLNWNTARPEFNPYQLDPSLLHNGFLFDKRQMESHKLPTTTTKQPTFTTIRKDPVTFKPRLTTSTTMPRLPPPGGDVPPYMSFVNEAKAQFEAAKQNTPKIEPPILKKIPVFMTPKPKVKEVITEGEPKGPFSVLSGFMPNWFQETTTNPPLIQKQLQKKLPPTQKKLPPVQKKLPPPPPQMNVRPKGQQRMPLLPPPKDFPSYEKAKRKQGNRRPMPPYPKRGGPPPILSKIPMSKGGSKIALPPNDYADFVRREFVNPTKPPVQLIPRKDAEFISQHKYYNPKRRLKIVEKKKGLFEQILSLPERLPRLPYLSSSVSVPSVESGNATTTEITQMKALIDEQTDLTDEEKELLKKLTEEPTSISADLLPKANSFGPPYAPKLEEPSSSTTTPPKARPARRRKPSGSSLGMGFDPMGIEPESGFKPIVEGQGSSIPTLAFSVLDGAERPPVSADIYQSEPKLEDYYYYYEDYDGDDGAMDRGVTPINVPAPVVPYVPSSRVSNSEPPKPPAAAVRPHTKPSSADFSAFGTTTESYDPSDDYYYDEGFVETDRIDPPQIDPNALIYSAKSAPYGEQFPSYLPKTMETRIGTSTDSQKSFETGDNVVYGKMDDEYYEDSFDYYYEEDLKDLKQQLGINDEESANKMSFLQLLQNLQSE